MPHHTFKAIAITLLALAANQASPPAAAQPTDSTATIDSGAIQGTFSDDVLSFKGIPFAAPPVGALRWRAPQAVTPWTGVREAGAFGHDCMQVLQPGDAAPPGTEPSEDCLVLNVWRPARLEPGERLPVMVWIHGGGYVNGGTSASIYDGSALARQRVILVSANYRLGRFGFFAHPALLAAKEGPVGMSALTKRGGPLTHSMGPIVDGRMVRGSPEEMLMRRVAGSSGESANAENADATIVLENTRWKLISLGGTPVTLTAQQKAPDLVLDSKTRRVSGFGGCNRFMGSYELQGERLSFDQLAGTMMACAEGMEVEAGFLRALTAVKAWRIAGRKLELLGSGGNVRAGFEAHTLK